MEEQEKKIVEKINETIEKKVSEIKTDSDKKNVEIEKQVAELKEVAKVQGIVITELKEKTAKTETFDFSKKLEEVAKTVKGMLSNRTHGFVSIEKQVGTMSEASNITGRVPQYDLEAGYNMLPKQSFILRSLSNVGNTISNMVAWVEQQLKEGGAGMTAEGTSKTQQDWEFKENSKKVEKITSFVKVTEEMLNDVPQMRSIIDGELVYEILLKEEQQLLAGDGNTPNLKGVTLYAQTLDLASLADSTELSNYWDVLRAAIVQIYVNGKGMFIPNAIVLNPVDYYKMTSTKNTEGDYIAPLVTLPDGTTIDGVRVLQSVSITAGRFLVGDFRRFNIRDREGLRIEVGFEMDDFTKNLVTIRAEKRLVDYVKANDVEAFIYDTFATAQQFILKAS